MGHRSGALMQNKLNGTLTDKLLQRDFLAGRRKWVKGKGGQGMMTGCWEMRRERALEHSGEEGAATASMAGGGSWKGGRNSKGGRRERAGRGPPLVQWRVWGISSGSPSGWQGWASVICPHKDPAPDGWAEWLGQSQWGKGTSSKR